MRTAYGTGKLEGETVRTWAERLGKAGLAEILKPIEGKGHETMFIDWGDADVGRVVTSPSDHSKYALYATMQGDAPYPESSFVSSSHNGRRPVTGNYNNRLSSFGGKSSHHRNRQQTGSSSMGEEAPRKAQFQLRDPPRPRVGSARLAASRAASSHSRWSDTNEDVGVIRGYVVGRSNNNPLFSSRPSRRSSDAETVSCYQLIW